VKKAVLVCMAGLLLVGGVYLAGCGSTTSAGGVTEAQLGVPVYPGATKTTAPSIPQRGGQNGSTPRFQGSAPNGSAPRFPGSRPQLSQGSAPTARRSNLTALWTKDDTSKVATWYRDKLSGKPNYAERNMPARFGYGNGGNTTMFSFKSGDTTKTVVVRGDMSGKGGTVIMVGDLNMPQGQNFQQGQPPDSTQI
jgi:hypothetical protein